MRGGEVRVHAAVLERGAREVVREATRSCDLEEWPLLLGCIGSPLAQCVDFMVFGIILRILRPTNRGDERTCRGERGGVRALGRVVACLEREREKEPKNHCENKIKQNDEHDKEGGRE